MQGQVGFIEKKVSQKSGKNYYEVIIDGKKYISTSEKCGTVKAGETIEFEVEQSQDGKTFFLKFPGEQKKGGGGGRPTDPRAFAVSYAKDIVVELIRSGAITTAEKVDSNYEHFAKLSFKLITTLKLEE